MDYLRFDNYYIDDLLFSLQEDSTLKRYYPLIAVKKELHSLLEAKGIFRKEDYSPSVLNDVFDEKTVRLFTAFVHLYDFTPVKLKTLSLDNGLNEFLSDRGITDSGQLLTEYENYAFISPREKLQKLYALCNLMRLPSVKERRAKLYYDCGYRTFSDFLKEPSKIIRSKIQLFITENNREETAPFIKEINTHKAVAKMLEHISCNKKVTM